LVDMAQMLSVSGPVRTLPVTALIRGEKEKSDAAWC
jgi:hypothetical protein